MCVYIYIYIYRVLVHDGTLVEYVLEISLPTTHITMTWAPRCHYTNGIIIIVIKEIDRDYPEEFMSVARKKIGESSLAHYFWKRKARSSGCLRHQALRSSSSSLRAAIFHKPQSLSDGLYCLVRESLFLFFSSALLLDFSHFFSQYFKRISYHKRNPPSTLSIYAFTSVKDMHARIYINCYDTHIYRSSNKLQKSH